MAARVEKPYFGLLWERKWVRSNTRLGRRQMRPGLSCRGQNLLHFISLLRRCPSKTVDARVQKPYFRDVYNLGIYCGTQRCKSVACLSRWVTVNSSGAPRLTLSRFSFLPSVHPAANEFHRLQEIVVADFESEVRFVVSHIG